MTEPLRFASREEYVARRGDVAFWRPQIDVILARHRLPDGVITAGFNATHPTFLVGDVVVKLFGHGRAWRRSHWAERAAHACVETDATILAPHTIAHGDLSDDGDAPWPYLISSRIDGVSWRNAALTSIQRTEIATDLARQIKRVHALPPSGAATAADWAGVAIDEAAHRSSLPAHLAAQAGAFVDLHAGAEAGDRVFVHGDLCRTHVFIAAGRLRGIIDWGDAMLADPHYELVQLHRDLFASDKALLRAFLTAYDWPLDAQFPRRMFAQALHRQAIGLAQHDCMDVFEPIAEQFPLHEIATLDELAMAWADIGDIAT